MSDAALVEAFERVDAARGDVSLTFFEFGTLAAADVIERARVDVAVMEVGLGGRLDAVNAFEPSVSLITAIGVDHRAWLGDDRESVGREKAGIMRTAVPCVIGERSPPRASSTARAQSRRHAGSWAATTGSSASRTIGGGGVPDARSGSCRLPGSPDSIRWTTPRPASPCSMRCLRTWASATMRCAAVSRAPGSRADCSGSTCRRGSLVDVAHNPLAAEALAAYLASFRPRPMRRAVCGVLGDKDAGAMLRGLVPEIDVWYFASLPGSRGRDARELAGKLPGTAVSRVFDSVEAAFGPRSKIGANGKRSWSSALS